ncbi:MAG: VOC family protein [Lachnospiraceae bacterium]|jgi:predicted enzyme related to lactoylglutathione lyase|nr:VOC family protein [Lachnospiraceae bacterium]
MEWMIRSLYLCVKDMDRAIRFYEEFFEQPVMVKDRIYSIFDINGFRLGLFAYEEVEEPHTYGTNCLPSIEVENLEVLKKTLDKVQLVFPLTKIKDNWVAEFRDSEGNHLEITAPA